MGLNLYMIGLIVKDMGKALDFYRQLGLDIPAGSERRSHVEIKMDNGLTFFLDSKPQVWDRAFVANDQAHTPASATYRAVLEFYLESEAAVDAKYQQLINLGYQSHAQPANIANGMRFAFINDPDGNTILLSGLLAGRPDA
jgi:catechol 2,3-dioxygenase-like lactoylglutathione lyase family enzyme